jgi:hypothetical protein
MYVQDLDYAKASSGGFTVPLESQGAELMTLALALALSAAASA